MKHKLEFFRGLIGNDGKPNISSVCICVRCGEEIYGYKSDERCKGKPLKDSNAEKRLTWFINNKKLVKQLLEGKMKT